MIKYKLLIWNTRYWSKLLKLSQELDFDLQRSFWFVKCKQIITWVRDNIVWTRFKGFCRNKRRYFFFFFHFLWQIANFSTRSHCLFSLSVCLFVSIYLSLCLFVSIFSWFFVYLSIYLSLSFINTHTPMLLALILPVCLFVFCILSSFLLSVSVSFYFCFTTPLHVSVPLLILLLILHIFPLLFVQVLLCLFISYTSLWA